MRAKSWLWVAKNSHAKEPYITQRAAFLDWELLTLACSEERQIVMVHSLKWKAQPSVARIGWLRIGEQHRQLATLRRDHPA
jgi:hypothetical protein